MSVPQITFVLRDCQSWKQHNNNHRLYGGATLVGLDQTTQQAVSAATTLFLNYLRRHIYTGKSALQLVCFSPLGERF
jgi:hypothetical protein